MNEILMPLLIINATSLILIIFYGMYIFRFNAKLAEYMDFMHGFVDRSNNIAECGNTHMKHTINDINTLTGLATAIHVETGQLLSKVDKINQSKKQKPNLKITKTKKASTKAKAKTAKPGRKRATG